MMEFLSKYKKARIFNNSGLYTKKYIHLNNVLFPFILLTFDVKVAILNSCDLKSRQDFVL